MGGYDPYALPPLTKPTFVKGPTGGSASLLNPKLQLKLDPEIEAQLRSLGVYVTQGRTYNLFPQPDWSKLEQDWRFQRMLKAPPPQPPKPLWPPKKGPDKPKPGEIKDVVKAVGKIPQVKEAIKKVEEAGKTHVKRLWNGSSTGEKVLVISHTTLLASGLVAGIVSNKEARKFAFGFIENKNIPVPGIEGFTFRVRRTGGGFTSPYAVEGMKLSYDLDVIGGNTQFKLMLNFDLMEFLRKRRRK